LSRRKTVIQDLLVLRQFSLVPDNETNVNVEAWHMLCFFYGQWLRCTTSTNLKSGPIPLYTIPTFLVTISILCMLFSSYRIDFCFFSVAKTTPLVAKKKLIKYIIFLEFFYYLLVIYIPTHHKQINIVFFSLSKMFF
jgi:hypothetical protein